MDSFDKMQDARGNQLSDPVKKALRSATKAFLSGLKGDQAQAGLDYGKLKGGEFSVFRDTWTKVKSGMSKSTTNYEEADVTKKGMSEETKQKLKDAKAAKKGGEKKVKEEMKYDFSGAKDKGTRVFTAHGVGVVRGYDTKQHTYQIFIEDAEQNRAISEKGVRFKAVDEKYRDKYQKDPNVKTASGAASVSVGDEVAHALNGLDTQQLSEVAKLAGLADRFRTWADRNPGMQRMNLSNVIRGIFRREDPAEIKGARMALQLGTKMDRHGPLEKEKKAPKAKAEKVKEQEKAPEKGSRAKGKAQEKKAKPTKAGKEKVAEEQAA